MQTALNKLSSKELLIKLELLARTENEATVQLVAHLVELERRRSYLELGYLSLFDYLRRKLLYSEPGAVRRITAARCVKNFPKVLELLLKREVSLSTVAVFASILKPENKEEVLEAVKGKSKADVERYVAAYRPRETRKKESIKPVTVIRRAEKPTDKTELPLFNDNPGTASAKSEPAKHVEASPAPSSPVEREERFELKFSVDEKTMEQLNRARILLSQGTGKSPSLEEVFEACLSEYLKVHDPKKREERRTERQKQNEDRHTNVAKVEDKLPSPEKVRSRHIPDAVYDAVMNRDDMCCSYVGLDGTKCSNRIGLQVDHVLPFGKGGEHRLDNLRALCAKHNRLEARNRYGAELMMRYCKV